MGMTVLAVSAIGADRPGIVASVTGVLYQHGCNLEDTEMAVLRGHFAMMLIVSAPDLLTADALEQALTEATGTDLVVAVRAIDDSVPAAPAGDRWSVAVYGADRPGIVHGVTSLLADADANVLDLETRVIGDAARPVYAMLLEITVPPDVDGDALAARLMEHARAVGVECTMRPAEADVF
jgi:glycine cleavage system transcriptional repressor